MKDLQTRKRELIVACRIQREVLGLELDVLRLHGQRLRQKGRVVGDAWKWFGPMMGLWVARRFRRPPGPWGPRSLRLMIVLKLVQWLWSRREKASPRS